jgi:hypothetical protein
LETSLNPKLNLLCIKRQQNTQMFDHLPAKRNLLNYPKNSPRAIKQIGHNLSFGVKSFFVET